MESGGVQHIHYHDPEQMYYILEGTGVITVNNKGKNVNPGDCIFFNSNEKHGLKNTGKNILKYLSATAPSFTIKQCEELWPLKSLNDIK